MATTDKEFLIQVKADINKAVTDMRKLSREIGKEGKAAKTAAVSNSKLAGSMKGLVAAMAAYVTIGTAVKSLKIADEWAQQEQRIKTATKATGDYNKVSEQLYELSQKNGAAMSDTVSTFQRLALARDELDATNDEIVKVTDSVQQLGIMSGASATAMQAGMLQFAQAMSAGTVRAEELNSILENMPAVANRIAKGMGKTVGELRQAVLEGKVLSREVFDALLSQSGDIADEFAAIPDNLDRAANRLSNSMGDFIRHLDKGLGLSNAIAKTLSWAAGILDSYVENSKEINELFKRQVLLARDIATLQASLDKNPSDAGFFDTREERLKAYKKALEEVSNKIDAILKKGRDAAMDAAARSIVQGVFGGGDTGNTTGPTKEELRLMEKRLALSRATVESERSLATDAIERQRRALDAQLADNLISYREYYAKRQALSAQALDQEIRSVQAQLDAERKSLASKAAEKDQLSTKKNIIRLESQLIMLQRQRGDIGVAATRAQIAAERELVAELDQVKIRLLNAQGQTAAARTLGLENEFKDLLKRLKLAGDTEGEAIVRKLFDVEVARAQLNEIQAEYSRAMANMNLQEQSIEVKNESGLITDLEARKQIVELHQRTALEVEALIPKMMQLAEVTGDPDAIQRVRQLQEELRRLGEEGDAVFNLMGISSKQLQENFAVGLTGAIDDFISGTKTAGEAFRQFAADFLRQIANMIMQQMILNALQGIMGGASGGASVMHSGGIVGAPGSTRQMPSFAFANAPRYHSGGITGLKQNEMPAVLERGEEVLTRDDPRHAANGGAAGGLQSLRVIVVDDAERAKDFANSAEGDLVWIQQAQRNAMALRQVIG